MAAVKCVHKGCNKVFTDPEEPCVYHPGKLNGIDLIEDESKR